MNKNYKKLIRTLRRLFEIDRADLDFGFYRIMHAKAEQVQEFIEKDLLQTVEEAFGEQNSQNSQELLEKARQKVIQTLGEEAIDEDGNVNPAFASIPAGKQYQEDVAKILQQKADGSSETDIYDHLCRFFERYYEGGDFISRRYYARETSGKAAPYAIPYNGEEVKLHWANADQYYIKTTENYNNFTFDLRQAREIQAARESTPLFVAQDEADKTALRVHFKIKDAGEGEHGNVKATDANKRFFVLHSEKPVEVNEAGELVVNFEYKPLPGGKYEINAETGKQLKALYGSLNKGDMSAFDMATQILTTVESMDDMAEYHHLLNILSPTEKIKKRPLLVRYLNKYTASNTMDYFIHKDLGGFLRRELDFYIKNEVMHLDDIENADVPTVESYLARIKVLRRIAGKLIDFLAQLEDFQKKLWLKKKFVVESNYCVTLDRVPEELYGEIVDCDAQWLEWVGLGFLTAKDMKSTKKRKEVLEKEPYLVLDTKFYEEGFTEKLLASFDNLDEQCDGLLIHSENFQALNLLQERYREQVKCVYIDPPYNTGGDGFIYKDAYQHSSWCSLIYAGLVVSNQFLSQDAVLFSSIDDNESAHLKWLLMQIFGSENHVADIVWQKRYAPDIRTCISDAHEFIYCFAKDSSAFKKVRQKLPLTDFQTNQFKNPDNDSRGPWKAADFTAQGYRPNQMYEIALPSGGKVVPPPGRCWVVTEEKFNKFVIDQKMYFGKDGTGRPAVKRFLKDMDGIVPWTWWDSKSSGHSQDGLKESMNLMGRDNAFLTAKPTKLLKKIFHIASLPKEYVLDYFAGSGSTGQSVISLNREDGGNRKYILVEMGNCFNTVLKPSIQKVGFSKDWKDGNPKPDTKGKLNGISQTFKYLRLESYEDTLNNLHFDNNEARDKALATNPALKEDYTLNYMLDVETRGSQSLLNVDAFADPCRYTLKVKKPGSEECITQNIDLIETFNYLIGLRVTHLAAPKTFKAAFKRNPDPELPEDQHTKLVVDDTIRQDASGPWWFRKIEGWLPQDPANPNNGKKEKILIVWRKLTNDLEKDNVVLDEWFQKNRISTQDFEFDTIYVNGSNNLPNLQKEGDIWKVRLIEEEFMKKMWEVN